MNQYFDTIGQMASDGRTTTVFLPGSPGGMSELSDQIRTAVMSADAGNPTN